MADHLPVGLGEALVVPGHESPRGRDVPAVGEHPPEVGVDRGEGVGEHAQGDGRQEWQQGGRASSTGGQSRIGL